jgi:hypothetical protein
MLVYGMVIQNILIMITITIIINPLNSNAIIIIIPLNDNEIATIIPLNNK